jgi:ArsR family transcriptional regulator
MYISINVDGHESPPGARAGTGGVLHAGRRPDITPEQAGALAATFKALADPPRVRIVNLLANAAEPVCVCDFMPQLDLAQGTVSFHHKKLLDAGLLVRELRCTWADYSPRRDALDRLSAIFQIKQAVR